MPIFMATLPDSVVSALVQAGVLGPIVWWFMVQFRNERTWQQTRDIAQADAAAKREEKWADKMDSLVEAVGHLIRVTGNEVLTRPDAARRVREDTEELLSAVKERSERK